MATEMPTQTGVFTRASSGLVRQVKTVDVMSYGIQQIALSYIVFIVLFWLFYPGANMPLASLIATIAGLAMGVCYAMFSTLYPRSGGEYVYLSRTLFPAAGFMVSFSFAFWETFYTGINGAFFSLYSVSPFLAALGLQTHNQALLNASTWFSGHWGIFIGGSAMIIGLTWLQLLGAGVYFKWQRWATYLALGSLAVTLIVLFLGWTGALNFKSHFDALAGSGAYDKIVAEGVKAGVAPAPAFNFGETMKFMLWPAFSIWFAVASTSFSGEIKNVQRSQLIGITTAMVLMGGAFILLTAGYTGAFGSNFILSANNNYLAGTGTQMPQGVPPYVPLLTGILGGNAILTVIMSFWVLAIAVFVTGTTLVYSSRAALAWSIDGVAPEWLGRVNEKYHSPHWALIMWAIIGEIFLGLYAFTTLLGPISGFTGLAVSFVVVSLWAVFFPFVRKETFENSPIAWRIGGFPVMSLLGIVASILVCYGFYRLLIDNTFSLNLKFSNWGMILGLVFALIWFYAWKAYRKSQGVNLDRRYAEIPIE
jgi:amino acid transporter